MTYGLATIGIALLIYIIYRAFHDSHQQNLLDEEERKKSEEEQERLKAEEEEKLARYTAWEQEQKEKFLHKTRELIEQHRKALGREYGRLVTKDPYGNDVYEKWVKDGETYFIDNVLVDYFVNDYLYKDKYIDEIRSMVFDVAWEENHNMGTDYSEDMTGLEFEVYCKLLLETNGWDAQTTQKTSDQGVDIVASNDGIEVAIQCKKSKSPIGNKAVQEIVSGAIHYHIRNAVVVTNSSFTASAKRLAISNNVLLIHYSEIVDLYRMLT